MSFRPFGGYYPTRSLLQVAKDIRGPPRPNPGRVGVIESAIILFLVFAAFWVVAAILAWISFR